MKRGKPLFPSAACWAAVLLSAAVAEPVCIHVAPGGDDAGDGSAARPFRSAQRARRAVREMKARGCASRGVEVVFAAGTYPVRETLDLGAADSGEPGAPVVWRAAENAAVVFDGGFRVTKWRALGPDDAHANEQIPAAVRSRIRVADVAKDGYTVYPFIRYGGIVRPNDTNERVTDLYLGGEPQPLAREPNAGFYRTGSVTNACTFQTTLANPAKWARERAPVFCGYWRWLWWEDTTSATAISSDGRVTLDRAVFAEKYFDAITTNKPYFAANALCALDAPGEWMIDDGKLYLLPRAKDADCVLSQFNDPFVTLKDVHDVVLSGLSFRYGRNHALRARACTRLRLENCTVTCFGGRGFDIQGAMRTDVVRCRLDHLGHGGICLSGGNRRTLVSSESSVTDCTVSRPDRHRRTYSPGIQIAGVGISAAHNHVFDCRSTAVHMMGNDHTVAYNLIERCVTESDDQGAVESYGYPSFQGNRIVANVIRDIGGDALAPLVAGQSGLRLDDQISGFTIASNRFIRCTNGRFGGVQIHGGRLNRIENNLFVDCRETMFGAAVTEIQFTDWSWKDRLKTKGFIATPEKEDVFSPPYTVRYPGVEKVYEWPTTNYVERNIAVGSKAMWRQSIWRRPVEPKCDFWTVPGVKSACIASEAEIPAAARRIGFAPLPKESEIGCGRGGRELRAVRRDDGRTDAPQLGQQGRDVDERPSRPVQRVPRARPAR